MTKHGTKDRDPAVKARAEALSRLREEQKREGQSAMDDYLEKEKAERAKMATLRALRLATEAEAGVRPRVKRKGRREGEADVKQYQCGDCGVREGEIYEFGCDMELCPFCGYQLIGCACRNLGLVKTQREWRRLLNEKGRVPYIVYPNMCARCGALWPEMFSVPDEEWKRYVEIGERDKMLCKSCYSQIRTLIDNAAKCRASKRRRARAGR